MSINYTQVLKKILNFVLNIKRKPYSIAFYVEKANKTKDSFKRKN